MKLATFDHPRIKELHAGAITADGTAVWDLTELARGLPPAERPTLASVAGIIGSEGGVDAARRLVEKAEGRTAPLPLSGVRLRPPIVPGKIVCTGRNFESHLKEAIRNWAKYGKTIERPQRPMGFIKVSSAIVGHGDEIPYPRGSTQLDYEVELAIVIGRPGRYIPVERALDHVAGYTILNDMGARDIQFAEQLDGGPLVGKNMDGFAPFGPWITTADEMPDLNDLKMKLRVNGDTRQDGTTAEMIFDVPHLVSHWSQMTLHSGDVITTSTPEGIAKGRAPDPNPFYLHPGDVIETEIQGIGILRNTIGQLS